MNGPARIFTLTSAALGFFLLIQTVGCGGVDPDKPVATIDDETVETVITAGDYLYRYGRALEKADPQDKPEINTIEDARAFLDDLIMGYVLELEAEARGFGDDPVLERDIVEYERQVLYKMLRDDVLAGITVTEEEVRNHFELSKHPRYVSLIVTRDRGRAEEAKKALDAGRAFKEVAAEYSEDKAAGTSGGKYPGPIYYTGTATTAAIFGLKSKGDYTAILEGPAGDYYIYRYDGDAEPVPGKYEEEKEKIRRGLEVHKANEVIRERVKEIKGDVKIEKNEEIYRALFNLPPAEVEEKYYNRLTKIATVEGIPIYFDVIWDSFEYTLKLRGAEPAEFQRENPREYREIAEATLDTYIEQALVVVEAARRGITEREDFLRDVHLYRGGKLIDMMYQKVFVPTVGEVTEKDVALYFEKHKSDYAVPETMEGTCIILKDRGFLEELRAEVRRSGDFGAAAGKASKYLRTKYGEPPSGGPSLTEREGEVVTAFKIVKTPRSAPRPAEKEPWYDKALREHAFDYPAGAMSPVLDIGGGRFLLLKNKTYTPYEEKTLDDKSAYFQAKADAQTELMLNPETERKCLEWFENLKSKHKIVIHEGVLKSIFKQIQKEKA